MVPRANRTKEYVFTMSSFIVLRALCSRVQQREERMSVVGNATEWFREKGTNGALIKI
jgi:hypothetical protein